MGGARANINERHILVASLLPLPSHLISLQLGPGRLVLLSFVALINWSLVTLATLFVPRTSSLSFIKFSAQE